MRILGFGLLATALSFAAAPVQLSPQPQKFRTFYALSGTRVPAALDKGKDVATASDGVIWRGTREGLWRGRHEYFAGQRYLPDDDVQHLLPDNAAGMWVRTRTGVSHIELRPMTMAAKAALFETRVHERHDRYGLVSPSDLRVPGDLATNQMRDDDNDGLWTSMYAAAECFRYNVTKSPEALAYAKKSTGAVLFLEEVTGGAGFPARSYIRKGEPMPHDGEWHWTPAGKYYWKGDTSSDEIVGHFFLYGVATDLLPDGDLKRRIRATAARIMNRIIGNGYYLVDLSGKPTTWGRWSLAYFRQEPGDSPLNALELLSFLKTAAHITRDPRYEREYRKAAVELGYAALAGRYRELREEINYSDEELAMLAFYGLFRYETDAVLLRDYHVALDAWWENIVREQNPLWSLIYAFGQPAVPVDLLAAVHRLYRMPVDTIDWTVKNSNRADIEWESSADRFRRRQAKTLLPPDELPARKWNSNPFDIDGGSGGHAEDDGTAFLLPYWLGRYHRLLLGE